MADPETPTQAVTPTTPTQAVTPTTPAQAVAPAAIQEETKGSTPQIVIVSRVRDLFHENDINTSSDFIDAINLHVIEVCRKAIARCKGNSRKTARPVDL
jgi:hypothetical protein